jgi:hypothetical protein
MILSKRSYLACQHAIVSATIYVGAAVVLIIAAE